VIYPVFYIITGWRCFQASHRGTPNERKAWRFFAAACFSLSWAELIWGFYETYMGINIPTPSIADIGFLLFPLFVISGFWFYYYKESDRKITKTQIGDFGIIFSVIFLAHVFLFQSQISVTNSLAAIFIQILYGIEIVIALCVGLVAVSLHVTGKKRRILTLITLFMAGLVVMNFSYSYALFTFEYTLSLPINTVYFVSMSLLYMAAFEHDILEIDEGDEEQNRIKYDRAKQYETLIPTIAIILVFIEVVLYRDALNETSLPYVYVGVLLFIVSLGYRNWWGHSIEVSLRNDALDSKEKLLKLNQDLMESKNSLQLALEANESGTWDWNIQTGVIHFDSNWLNLTGYKSEEAVINLEDWEKLIHPNDLAEHENVYDLYFNKIIDSNETEYRIKHKDGYYIWLSDRGKFVEWDDNGQPVRMIGVDTNITQRKEQDELIRHSQKMDALGKLTGGIAHDFNNLLGIILGYTQLLKNYKDSNFEQSNYIEQIHKAGERGAKLTKKLLSFTSKQVYEAKKIDLKSLIRQQQDMLQKTLTVRVKLIFEFADEVWPVFINDNQLEDVILNICINAMHAMDDEDSEARLTISISNQKLSKTDAQTLGLEQGDYVLLSFSDTGCGMDEATKAQIFAPFFTTKGDKGTGLGLYQVFGFVENSNGAIVVNSKLDIGSQFHIYLPRFSDDLQETSQGGIKNIVSGGNETILLVDDETALLDMLKKTLIQQGYQIFTAHSGQSALQILKNEQVDLMMTDIIMPDMDGYELSKIVKENYPGIKIQLVSGFTDEQNQDLVDEKLQQNIVYKPYNKEILLHNIRVLLDT